MPHDDTSGSTPPVDAELTTRSISDGAGGQVLGRYRLHERIGAGGMGEVYRAEQTHPVQRIVAVKVIKRGMDTERVIARFEAERQALALMDHPNIAKVLDAGSTPRGRPYFVMEYVKGVPITEYCDKHKLTTQERLQLFMQVCDGIQHAHQKAIIHRDLKPSNLLVTMQDDRRVPKIIDFGVAKATAQKLTEKTVYTALGELIGTPEYMSPEQAEMTGEDIDTRTDVYSLGVVLYALLAGGLPFEPEELRQSGFEGIVRMIREKDPPRPSTKVSTLGERTTGVAASRRTVPGRLRSQLQGDLDWITMKALEKDRVRRYASAAELAADVRRHLRHEPVAAGPPGAGYRAKKFVRRHRAGVLLATVFVVLLAGFAVSMGVQAVRIAQERDRANVETQAAHKVTEFLVELFDTSDPWETLDSLVTARAVLDRGSDRIDRDLKDQPLMRARLMETMGRVYQRLGVYAKADELLLGALELRRHELGEKHADVAKSLAWLGTLRQSQRRFDEGIELTQRALEIQEQVLSADDIDVAGTLLTLGALVNSAKYNSPSDLAVARNYLERARRIFERELGPDDLMVSWCWNNLGIGYIYEGDFANARECYKRAIEIKERVRPPDHPDLALSLYGLAEIEFRTEDYEQAKLTFERVLGMAERTLGAGHDFTGNTYMMLGGVLRRLGDNVGAEKRLQQSVSAYIIAHGENSDSVAYPLSELALIAADLNQYDKADSLHHRALTILEGVHGSDHFALVPLLEEYATTQRAAGKVAEADRLEARARSIREAAKKEGAN